MIKKYLMYIVMMMIAAVMISCGESGGFDDDIPSHKKFLKKYEPSIMTQAQIDEYVKPDGNYLKIDDKKQKFTFWVPSLKIKETSFIFSLVIKQDNGLEQLISIDALIKENKFNIKYYQIIDGKKTMTNQATSINGTMDINMAEQKFLFVVPKTELKNTESGKESIFTDFKISNKAIGGGSATVSLKNEEEILITNGDLGRDTYYALRKLLNENPKVGTIVLGQVNGSVDDRINVETGRMIRAKGLNTKVLANSDIASGGVDLYTSGVIRTYTTGAKIGVHSWSGEGGKTGAEFPKDDEAHYSQLGYFTKMLPKTGYDFYFYTLQAAPFDDIHYMSEDELSKYKVISIILEFN